MAIPKKDKKQKAIAFVNWEITTKSGKVVKSDKGFPLFQNPEYPNLKEDLLIQGAQAYIKANPDAKFLELDMKVRIGLNNTEETSEIKPDELF